MKKRISTVILTLLMMLSMVISASAATLGTNTKGNTSCSWRAWHNYSVSQNETTFTVNYSSATVKNDIKKTTDTFTVQTQIVKGSGTQSSSTGVVARGGSKKMVAKAKGYYNFNLSGCAYSFQKTTSAYTVSIRVANTTETSGNRSYINLTVPALNKYTLTFNANGGTNAPGARSLYYGSAYGTLGTPSRTGYTFNGWFTSASGGSQVSSGTVIHGNTTIFAHWTPNQYDVVFNANGGNGGPVSQKKVQDKNLALSTEQPTRDNYQFLCWNTKANGTGTNYAPGATYTGNGPITLYAQWDADAYEIRYDANGGEGAPKTQNKIYGIDLELSASEPTLEFYDFMGWNTEADGSGDTYQPGAVYTLNEPAILYAQWEEIVPPEPDTWIVKFNANGHGTAPETQYVYDGTTAEEPTIEAGGFDFEGWFSDSQCERAWDFSSPVSENMILYAKWTPNEFDVVYDANSGQDAPEAQVKHKDVDLVLSEKVPTRVGYTFKNWNTQIDGSGDTYGPGNEYFDNAPVTLYAQWQIINYKVSFNANGGTNAPGQQNKNYGSYVVLSSSRPSRSGFSFTGWNTKANGTGTTYQPGTVYRDNTDVTLYAQWKQITYKVSYNANGGSGAPGAQTKIHGTNLKLSSVKPTRANYTFTGWSGGGATYGVGGTYTANANVTLVAQWKWSGPNFPRDGIVYLAHKGYSSAAPQNTLAAYRAAARAGFSGVEMDVWHCRGCYLMSHDKNLRPYTGKSINITSLTTASRYNYPIIHGAGIRKYGRQVVPTLQESLHAVWSEGAAVGNPNIIVELDIKQDNLSSACAKQIAGMLGSHPVRINTDNASVIKKFKKYKNGHNIQLWMYCGKRSTSRAMSFIKKAKKAGVYGVSMPPGNWNTKTINYARSKGLKVAAYTNNMSEIRRLQRLKFNRLCVNKPVW